MVGGNKVMHQPAYVSLAESLARRYHASDVDKSGAPYLHHIERVATGVVADGSDAVAVAWLHDLLEDHPEVTADFLRAQGIPEAVVVAVQLLTRDRARTYAQYIHAIKVSGNPLALAVKKADLQDHLGPECPPSLLPRYTKAWAVLSV